MTLNSLALALCSSEFQLICLNESIGAGLVPSCSEGLRIVAFATDRPAVRIKTTAARLGLRLVVVPLFPGRLRYYSGKVKARAQRRRLARVVPPTASKMLYLGGYARAYVPLVRALLRGTVDQLILGDDGLGSPIYWDGFYAELAELRDRGVSQFDPDDLILHTFLDARRSHLRSWTNDFEVLRSLAVKQVRSGQPSVPTAWIIGQPYVTYGLLSASEYAEHLGQLAKAIDNRQGVYDLVYVPHPTEDPGHVRAIGRLGWSVRQLDVPIELYAAAAANRPVAIAGFASTAMVTLPRVIGSPLDVYVARVSVDVLDDAYRDMLSELAAFDATVRTIVIDCP